MRNKTLLFLKIFLILGILASLFLVYQRFSDSASEICSFNPALDCKTVSESPYATLDGISYLLTIDLGLQIPLINLADIHPIVNFLTSNAFLGLTVLLFTLLLVHYGISKNKDFLWIKKEKSLAWTKGILIFSTLYGIYLFLVQKFILHTYCIFCLSLEISIAVALILSLLVKRSS